MNMDIHSCSSDASCAWKTGYPNEYELIFNGVNVAIDDMEQVDYHMIMLFIIFLIALLYGYHKYSKSQMIDKHVEIVGMNEISYGLYR